MLTSSSSRGSIQAEDTGQFNSRNTYWGPRICQALFQVLQPYVPGTSCDNYTRVWCEPCSDLLFIDFALKMEQGCLFLHCWHISSCLQAPTTMVLTALRCKQLTTVLDSISWRQWWHLAWLPPVFGATLICTWVRSKQQLIPIARMGGSRCLHSCSSSMTQ